MKKRIPLVFMGVTVALCCSFGFTACEEKDNLEFAYTGNAYTVTGLGTEKSSEIVIPSAYKGKPVTAIADLAFWGCDSLTKITVPDSVTSIGDFAFAGCDGLQFNEYDNGLYLGNGNNPYLVLVKPADNWITSCKINERTKIVAGGALYECGRLKNVTVPNGIISVGGGGFGHSEDLQLSEYGNGLYLGNEDNPYLVLYKVKDEEITSCTINENTKVISGGVFYNCSELTEITIPRGISVIEKELFGGCVNLTSVTLPDGLKVIGNKVFSGCTSLKNINIPDSVVSIGYEAFYNCGKIEGVNLPNGLVSIGYQAFSGCRGFSEIVIPESVAYIGNLTFDDCRYLTINCQSASCPEGWKEDWNKYRKYTGLGYVLYEHPVVWNYK